MKAKRHKETIKVSGRYEEVSTKTVDEKRRLTVGEPLQAGYRVKVYKNEDDGTFLLVPLVEIPEREMWLYKNKKALKMVLDGIKAAEEGDLYKLDLKTMKTKKIEK